MKDLVRARHDPRQVEDEERCDDGDGDVRHVDLFRVPVGPALMQQHDPLADADVQDHQDEDGGQAGRRQGVDLRRGNEVEKKIVFFFSQKKIRGKYLLYF